MWAQVKALQGCITRALDDEADQARTELLYRIALDGGRLFLIR